MWPWITACILSRDHTLCVGASPNVEGKSGPTVGACLCLFVQQSQQFFSGPTADSIIPVGPTVSAGRTSGVWCVLVCVGLYLQFPGKATPTVLVAR